MSNLVRVEVTRTFNQYMVGDELLVSEDDPEVVQLVKAKLFQVIAVESPPAPKPAAKAKAPAKSKTKAKPGV